MGAKRMKTNESENIETEAKKQKNGKNKKGKKKRHIFLKVVIVLVAIIVVLAGVLAGFVYSKLNLMDYDSELDKNDIAINEGIDTTGYLNILLLGVDSREEEYSDTRSDTIMIVSINQDTKKIKIVSVYRDTYLQITGYSLDKVTHAFAKGGATLSMSTLNTNLDLDITDYVAVNFEVVVDVVNAVGGIEMEITSEETKYINAYIDEVNSVTGHSSSHITTAGTYTLDGVQALAYARIRYTSGGDYKRTERQRDVLYAVFEKAKTMSLTKLNSLANTILPEVSTNISSSEIIYLLTQIASYDIEETTGWPYDVQGYQPSSVWYAAPVNLATQVSELHEFLFDEEDYEVSSTVQTISNAIIKATGYK